MVQNINESTRFFVITMPNLESLRYAQYKEILPVLEIASEKIKACLLECKLQGVETDIVVFVSVQGTNSL
jgi:hypothetical protein